MADIRKNGKQYGLICPRKPSLTAPKAINVFGNEEDSENEDGTDWVKKALKAECEKNRAKKQTRLNIQKALKEDPTICQYDEVFDEMKRSEESSKTRKKEVKKAKYIDSLLKTADRRKREQEHRIERMVQKEREAEGAMYADKESFVTSAYRAKLEEFKKMEKDEENMDRLESIGDVTKQQDISGFYRHFFHQTVDTEKSAVSETLNEKLDGDRSIAKIVKNMDEDDPSGSASEQSSDHDEEIQIKKSKISRRAATSKKQDRQYRRRAIVDALSESEIDEPKVNEKDTMVTNEENPSEENISDDKELEQAEETIERSSEDKRPRKETNDEAAEGKSTISCENDITMEKSELRENIEDADRAEEEKKKNKVSIWEKRTVGPVFEAALQRYYVRKTMRLSGS